VIIKGKETESSGEFMMIATTAGVGLLVAILLIAFLVYIAFKYKQRKRTPELSTPVSIPLEVNEPLQTDEENQYEDVSNLGGYRGYQK
jgi:heme/copper-type cytochrome/quinol oxidase subunit 2